MAHVHDHQDSSYFMEQLCTIGVCGALGGVVVMLWLIPGGLNFLGEQFQKPFGNPWLSPVLWGGVAVVTLVLIRAVAVWISVGKPRVAHDHVHSPEHHHAHDHALGGHDHAHCDHDHDHAYDHVHAHDAGHDHGHEHGWAPWRYVILLLPVGLYFLGLIPKDGLKGQVDINTNFAEGGSVGAKGGEVIHGFLELGRASATEQSRAAYEGRTASVIGQAVVNEGDRRRFGLKRYKISCCAADAIPLKLVVLVPDTAEGKAFDARSRLIKGQEEVWVEVTGIIQFRRLQDSDEYITVLEVPESNVRVKERPPSRDVPNPFVY